MTSELALVARARGLSTHLLDRATLESLAEAPELTALARGLAHTSRLEPMGDATGVAAIEQSVRRTATRHLRTLARWQEAAPGILDVFFADQERRSLRALLRGALQGAPSEARLAGLMPTPGLPERALTELARQPSPKDVVLQLVLLHHPVASQLLPPVSGAQPELFALEAALLRGLAERAGAAARAGDAVLRDYVAERVDLGNVQNALLLGRAPPEVESASCFVQGGRWLSRDAFLAVAQTTSRPVALERVREALEDSPLADVFPMAADDSARVERQFLAQMLERLRPLARSQPLGSAPILRFLLALEAQSRDVRTLAWGVTLGAPPSLRRADLVTPWP
jgi:vacuolar-type H+-ATPase subunit C/Vma6